LFTGIGGTHLALSSISKPVAYCEIDNNCVSVIERRLPRAPIFPDVTKLSAKDLFLANTPMKPQLVTASFPCQDVSVAGRGQGLGVGTRSSLVFDVFRLVEELGPSVELLFLENSPAIRTRGLDQLLDACRRRGFDRVVWTYASARDVGAHHKRKRFFLLASRAISKTKKIPTTSAWDGFAFRDASVPRLKPRGDEAASSVERKRVSALGNAVVPAALAAAWNTLARALNDDDVPGVREVFLPSPLARQVTRVNTMKTMKTMKTMNLAFVLPDGSKKECDMWTTPVHHPSHWYPRSRYEGRAMRSLATQVFHERGTQRTFGFRNVQLGRLRFSLNPEWVEALMGFPKRWTQPPPKNK
jgi:DNA (cytosine-5)-methyltransferase 1